MIKVPENFVGLDATHQFAGGCADGHSADENGLIDCERCEEAIDGVEDLRIAGYRVGAKPPEAEKTSKKK